MEHLGKIPVQGECPPCGIDFETSRADVMEISFRVHPQIRPIASRVYCAAEPATKAHIRLQRTLMPGEQTSASTLLGNGRYSARMIGSKRGESWILTDEAASARIRWRASEGSLSSTVRARPEIELVNDTAETQTFVVEQSESDADALRPRDVFGLASFREEFSDEAIATGVALDIGVQTILFTDVVGSTRFYLDAGDTVAFAEVRRKFVIAWGIVEACDGAVVKTIGDAVMAAFQSCSQALDAAIQMQRAFDGNGECKLRIRVTLHCGPCLAVNLNTGVDYFGTTVNLAAKIQAMAGAGEIAWTESVQSDPAIAKILSSSGFVPESMPFRLASGDVEQTVYRIKVE
jgi:class 3 adenylate cyclase